MDEQREQLSGKILKFIRNIKIFFIVFMCLNIALTAIRLNLPNFESSYTDDKWTYVMIPIVLVCFFIELFMIAYFYDTGMKFVTILHE